MDERTALRRRRSAPPRAADRTPNSPAGALNGVVCERQDSPCAEANLLSARQPGLDRPSRALTGGRRSRTWQRSHERLPALALTTPHAISPICRTAAIRRLNCVKGSGGSPDTRSVASRTRVHRRAPSRTALEESKLRIVLKRTSSPLSSQASTAYSALSSAVDARTLGSAAKSSLSVGADHTGAYIF
jgi:hypothetical protein